MDEVIIIGAGAAGLMAARSLAGRGISVTILEARNRIGGRIATIESANGNFPIETGAEFVHGNRNAVWDLIHESGLPTHEVPDRHWLSGGGQLKESVSFWDQLEAVMKTIPDTQTDQDVLGWLASRTDLPSFERQMVLDYVEGFHAAPAERMGLRALQRANEASKRDEGERAFRVQAGYLTLMRRLLAMAGPDARLRFGVVVKKIRWEHGWAEVEAETPDGLRTLTAARVLLTVPLGVLKGEIPGIVFQPALTEKQAAIDGLEMGNVVKLTLQFHTRFWPVENFGFIHSDDEWLPTWWADERGSVLTGWAGGPRAQWLGEEHKDTVVAEAIRALSRIFRSEPHYLNGLLIDSWWHDWTHDPFARGAYSYTPAGNIEMPDRIAQPVAETLFFAGEATDSRGEQGTVHAALASGKRAAEEICASLRRARCIQRLVPG